MLTKRLALVLILVVSIFSLCSCQDLGDVEDEKDYYDTYDSVTLVKNNGDYCEDYTLEDFYNKDSVDSFACPISYSDTEKYCYMFIRIAKEISIGEFAVYFNSNDTGKLGVSFFLLDSDDLPENIMTSSSDVDEDDCDEPDDSKIIAKTSVYLTAGATSWSSIRIKRWKIGENETTKRLKVESGQYLVLRFDNNCYDSALKKFNKVKKEYEKVLAEYNEAKSNYDEKIEEINNSNSEEEKDALRVELVELNGILATATQNYNAVEVKYNTALQVYESEKSDLSEMSIRMTNIMIYTDKEA